MDSTIESKVRRIKRLAKKVNLWNVEEVKDTITLASWSNSYKELMEYAYCDWCEFQGFKYKPRRYYREETLPYIPAEKDIDQLIAGTNRKYAPMLQLLKESGWRYGEVVRLTPQDFNLERRIVTLNTPEKRSRPRQIHLRYR